MIGYKPAVLARLDPRTLRPLPGRRIRLRHGISSYGWSPDRSLLVLGDVDDDVVHLVDPVRMRRLGRVRGMGVTLYGPGTGLGTCSVPRTRSRPSSTATCCMRPSTPGPSRTAGWWRRRLRRCRSCCSGRVDRPAERQALFSAALGLEVEPPSEVEPLEPEEASAGFLALSPSVLAGLPRESVR